MSTIRWRALGVGVSVLVSAGIGIATNVFTEKPSWGWGSALVALVLSAVAVQVWIFLAEARQAPAGTPPASAVHIGHVTVGVPVLSFVLVLALFGIAALGLVVWAVPGRGDAKPPSGDPLLLTLTGVTNTCHSVVLPDGLGARATPFVVITKQPADPDDFMRAELDAGAYPHGELIVRLNAQTALPQQVTITDVQVADLMPAEPVRGALVNLHTCGSDAANAMVIRLNHPDRKPFAVDEKGHETGQHFFDTQVVNVAPGAKQSFVVRLILADDRAEGSYTFRLRLHYEVGGRKAWAVVDDGGVPFRLTGGCDFTSVLDSYGRSNELMRPGKVGDYQCA